MLRVPGEASTGSLGQGSRWVGYGWPPVDGRDYCIYAMIGTVSAGPGLGGSYGRQQVRPGQPTCILDHNEYQQTGAVAEVMPIEPVADRWSAFGWHVIEIDGHDLEQVFAAYDEARRITDRPTLINAHTVKGKGVRIIEEDVKQSRYHGVPLTEEQARVALEELA